MYRERNIKISIDDITYGPKDPDEFTAWFTASELNKQGYRKSSNAYCTVTRIDRDDWIHVLATQMRCAPADFYKLDGSGIDDRWRAYYNAQFSQDTLTVHPDVYKKMMRY